MTSSDRLRNYFYWEPHCFDIPVCWSLRSLFDSIDSVDTLSDDTQKLTSDIDHLDTLMPQMLALMPPMINAMKTTRELSLTMYSTMSATIDQMAAMNDTAIAMGQSFDDAQIGDLFYLPPEAFTNPEFQRGLKMFLSPDGKSARFFITHTEDPASPEGIAKVPAERTAAQEAVKQTSLSEAKIYLAGTAATYADMAHGAEFDLMIAVLAALTLIFMIMLIVTRALVASLVIVATAASSIAASFGLSVLIWQDIVGLPVYWVVALMAVIILLAVGSDYNLLLVSRFKEEIHAGLKTGFIRSMAGTGAVVTSAGLVFAFTMAAMLGSSLAVIGQFGSTVAIGLLLDTLIVRSLLMPSIATLLGRWFWWPLRVRTNPVPQRWPSTEQPTAPIPVERHEQSPPRSCDAVFRCSLRALLDQGQNATQAATFAGFAQLTRACEGCSSRASDQLGQAEPSMRSTVVVRWNPGMKCSRTSEFTVPFAVSGRFFNPSK